LPAEIEDFPVPRDRVQLTRFGDPGTSEMARLKLVDVIVMAGFAGSKREAERLIAGGGVKLDGVVVTDPSLPWTATEPTVLSVGARRHKRILP
jgi:tyrosyl-tRNA synthetase